MKGEEIIAQLPYSDPFLFVDEIGEVNEHKISGSFHFGKSLDFYRGHFVGHPITPGVILVECMAQIALVSHGLFLLHQAQKPIPSKVAFTSANVNFLQPVFPGETVQVHGQLVYFRMGIIKSRVVLMGDSGESCKGELTGMLRP